MTTANLPAVAVPYGDLERMAERIVKSRLFGMQNVDQAVALLLVAQAAGLHPATACQDYHIVDGKPAKKAEAMMRDLLRGGGRVEWHTLTDTEAAATFSHPQGGTVRIDWDTERAKRAGIGGKGTWLKYPRSMLRSRVVAEGVRTVYPIGTGGLYTPEEVRDFDAPERPLRDVTPPPAARQPADDLAFFAGEHPPKAEPPPPVVDSYDPDTGEVAGDTDERPHAVVLETVDGQPNWPGWCSDVRDALMVAECEDDLLAIMEQNKIAMGTLASGGNGGRKAADRLRGLFTAQQIELRRRAAAA
jgi:hypothetical protein